MPLLLRLEEGSDRVLLKTRDPSGSAIRVQRDQILLDQTLRRHPRSVPVRKFPRCHEVFECDECWDSHRHRTKRERPPRPHYIVERLIEAQQSPEHDVHTPFMPNLIQLPPIFEGRTSDAGRTMTSEQVRDFHNVSRSEPARPGHSSMTQGRNRVGRPAVRHFCQLGDTCIA